MSRRTVVLWVLAAPLALVLAVPVLVLFALGAIPDEPDFDFEAWPYGDDDE